MILQFTACFHSTESSLPWDSGWCEACPWATLTELEKVTSEQPVGFWNENKVLRGPPLPLQNNHFTGENCKEINHFKFLEIVLRP